MNNNQDNRNKKNGRESRDPLRTGLPLLALAVVIVLLFNWVYNSITAAQLEMLLAGGLLNSLKELK